MTFERTKRVSQPEFTDQDLQINMIMPYLEIKIFFHKLVEFEKKIVIFHFSIPAYISAEMNPELRKIMA